MFCVHQRDVCYMLDSKRLNVVIVDTSSEIAGYSLTPHAAVGAHTRVLPILNRHHQHEVLVEAVQNHTPHVVVVDEVGRSSEVSALTTVSQRGTATVATAHGRTLQELLDNPELNRLVGGKSVSTVGDARAFEENNGKKTMVERAGKPVVDVVIEMKTHNKWHIHHDVAASVDALLAGHMPSVEERWLDLEDGCVYSKMLSGLDNRGWKADRD